MDPLANYVLPIGGLDLGIHRFQFRVDDYFLSHCPDSPYDRADVLAEIIADKRAAMIVLDIFLSGTVDCTCDRCTADIRLPIDSAYQVVLKVKEQQQDRMEDEIIYIEPGQNQFDVSKLLYDVFLVGIPLKKIYDCEEEENPPCNEDILDRLYEDTDEENEHTEPSIWDDIKKRIEIK